MQSSTLEEVTGEQPYSLDARSRAEIESDKLAFLKTVSGDGGRRRPTADVSSIVASDCDELLSEGLLESYSDVGGEHIRMSKAGNKHLQDLQVKTAESMSRALTKAALESPEQAIAFLEGQAILSTADLKGVLIFILNKMIPPAGESTSEHETEKPILAKMNKEKLAEFGATVGVEFTGEESKAEMIKLIEAKIPE